MKKIYLFKTLLLLCALMAGSASAWAETSTVTASKIASASATWTGSANETWSVAVAGGATNQNMNSGYAQVGTKNSPSTSITFSTAGISGTITKIEVDCASYGGLATLSATVGGNAFGTQSQSTPSWGSTGGVVTFTGSASGEIVITMTNGNGGRAMYIKSITVTYTTGSTSTKYSVFYDANGATSGSVPSDDNEYDAEDEVTVLDNKGNLAKTGYTFSGWNTQADGEGTNYTAGSTFEISATTTLYAEWTPNTHNVTLPTEDTYGSYAMSAENPVAYGTEVALYYNSATGYDNYAATWSVNGNAINGNTFTMPDEDVTVTVEVNEMVDYATLPFSWEGDASANLLALNGVTANGLGSDYAAGNAPYLVKLDHTGDYIQVKTNSQPGKVTIGVKMIGGASTSTITVQGSADGETFTNVEALTISGAQNEVLTLETINAFDSTHRYVRLLFTKGSNVGVGPISIAEPSTDPVINAAATIELAADATSGEIAYSISNPVSGTNLTASVESSCDWISNFTVGAENVTFTTTANTSAERSAVITLTYGTVTKEVTVTQADGTPVTTATYTLATEVVSGRHYIIVGSSKAMGIQNTNNRAAVEININDGTTSIASNSGVKEFLIEKDGDNFTIYDEEAEGYLYAASSEKNYLRTETELDGNGTWTISFEDGQASIVAQGANEHNVMQYNTTNSIFSCYASDSQSPVYLYVKDDEATPTETVAITSAGMATYYSENALDFTGFDDMWAYTAAVTSDGVITYTRINKVPALTAVVLYNPNKTSASHEVPVCTEATETVGTNNLIGVLEYYTVPQTESNGATNYLLNNGDEGVGFYKASGTHGVAAHRAYLQVPATANGVRFFYSFNEGGSSTGIEEMNSESMTDNRYYNLNGQQTVAPKKGLYIVNGKKVIKR